MFWIACSVAQILHPWKVVIGVVKEELELKNNPKSFDMSISETDILGHSCGALLHVSLVCRKENILFFFLINSILDMFLKILIVVIYF